MSAFYCSLIFSHSLYIFFRVFLIVQYILVLCEKVWSFLQRKIPFFRRFKSSGTWSSSSNHRKYGLEENITLPTTGKGLFILNVSDSDGKKISSKSSVVSVCSKFLFGTHWQWHIAKATIFWRIWRILTMVMDLEGFFAPSKIKTEGDCVNSVQKC